MRTHSVLRPHSLVTMIGILSAATAGCAAGPPSQLLVTGFTADAIARYDATSAERLGSFGPGSGMNGPLCARVGPDGWLYVASEESNSVLRFDRCTGDFHDVFVPAGAGGLAGPAALTWLPGGDLLVASFNSDAVLRYDGATGAFKSTFVAPGSGGLNGPDNGTIIGPDGDLYVPSYWTNRVLRYNGSTGAFKSVFINGVGRPRVLVFSGNVLLVTSETADAVLRYSATTGVALGAAVPPGSGGLDLPIGLAIAPSGPHQGDLYVTSGSQNAVYRFDGATGAFEAIVATADAGGVATPVFLTFVDCPVDSSPDIDGSGSVDAGDLALLLGAWGSPDVAADLDGSGVVDASDLAALLGAWS